MTKFFIYDLNQRIIMLYHLYHLNIKLSNNRFLIFCTIFDFNSNKKIYLFNQKMEFLHDKHYLYC